MKRFFPWILCLLFAVWAIGKMMPARQRPGFNVDGFGQLPVLVGGRVMPMDTLARVSLSAMNHHGVFYDSTDGKKAIGSQSQWLLETFAMPEHADLAKVFEVKALPGVLSLFGSSEATGGFLHYSFQDLKPFFPKIEEQAGLASQTEAESRDEFQREMIKLRDGLRRYIQLKNTLQPEDSPDFGKEIEAFEQTIQPGMEAIRDRDADKPFNQQDFERIILFTDRYQKLSQVRFAYAFPSTQTDLSGNGARRSVTSANDRWQHVSGALLSAIATGKLPYPLTAYGKMISAYRGGDKNAFNQSVQEYQQYLQKTVPEELSRPRLEFFFNHAQPFYQAILLYGLAFLFALLSWLAWPNVFRRTAVILLLFTFLLHTTGLVTRMYLQGRPPVTNLYSSAVFVGWGAVLFCLFLERIYKNGVGSVCGSAIGFLTLLIAQNLQWDGDSLEMLRAVLDTNIWLATHVVVVTLGYSATFLSGFLGIVYIVRGLLTKSFDQETSKSLTRMIYGVVCFATLFSFTGTILGGIWADQSWGRFWGWDPKENGALLIVLWNAIILHARWGGYARERGTAALAVFGNVVTSLSWFGVNMLGVGLHSYGFMDRAFGPLMIFIASQLLIVAAAMIPLKYWRGIRAREEKAPITGDPTLVYNR
jgi:ABC-type transport system involved in cytochrome c biogenesis permease subunit